MNESWDAYPASAADFVGADDIVTNLEKERAWDRDHRTHFLIIRLNYVGAFDRVTAAQCRGLSCEIEANCASHNKMAPKPALKSHGMTINTRGTDLKRLEYYAFS